MIKIDISYDLTVKASQVKKIPKRSGVYVIYDSDDKPLYVGQSENLKSRLYEHFNGITHTAPYSHHFVKCSVIFEDDKLSRDIYELYLINTLKTPINMVKKLSKFHILNLPEKGKRTLPTDLRCKHILPLKEKRCGQRAHSNGFCHLHGGNGITKTSIMKEAAKQAWEEYIGVDSQ